MSNKRAWIQCTTAGGFVLPDKTVITSEDGPVDVPLTNNIIYAASKGMIKILKDKKVKRVRTDIREGNPTLVNNDGTVFIISRE